MQKFKQFATVLGLMALVMSAGSAANAQRGPVGPDDPGGPTDPGGGGTTSASVVMVIAGTADIALTYDFDGYSGGNAYCHNYSFGGIANTHGSYTGGGPVYLPGGSSIGFSVECFAGGQSYVAGGFNPYWNFNFGQASSHSNFEGNVAFMLTGTPGKKVDLVLTYTENSAQNIEIYGLGFGHADSFGVCGPFTMLNNILASITKRDIDPFHGIYDLRADVGLTSPRTYTRTFADVQLDSSGHATVQDTLNLTSSAQAIPDNTPGYELGPETDSQVWGHAVSGVSIIVASSVEHS